VTDPIIVRKECTGDEPAIRTVLVSAFDREVEAGIVDRQRVSCPKALSLAWISHRGGCIGPGNLGSSFSYKGLIDSDVGVRCRQSVSRGSSNSKALIAVGWWRRSTAGR
jgi:hypothetical protein